MSIYAYRARDLQGRLNEGTIEVSSEAELARRLDAQGLLLTTAAPVRSKATARRGGLRLSKKELVTLTYNLETIYSAGIPVAEGLEDLAANAGNRNTARVATALAHDLQGGSELAGAMARFPRVFPPVYTSVVQAGESAGEAGPVLKRLAEYHQWIAETRANVMRALTYPVILMTAVAGVLVLLLTFLVPRILKVLAHTRAELPLPTKILMAASSFLRDNALLLAGALAGALIAFFIFRHAPRGRLMLDKLKLKIPVVGPLLAKVCAARFTTTVAMLYRAGIGTVQSLETAEQVVGNAYVAAAIRDARERVLQGDTLGDALRQTGAFQPLVVRMISLGEQTGTLDESLDRVSAFYDREIPQTIKAALNILEPAMILAAGVGVGFILLCTFLPIFQMMNSLHR